MAELPPGADVDSYSDPIYDRLESAKNVMAKRWPLIVIAALVVMAAVLVWRSSYNTTPIAEAAQRYREAQRAGADQLQGLIEDQALVVSYRVKAGLAVAADQAGKGENEAALKTLAGIAKLAKEDEAASGSPVLPLAVMLSEASVLEQQGAWQEARSLYETIEAKGARFAKPQALAASIGFARSLIEEAKTAEGEAAEKLRAEALEALEIVAESDEQGSGQLVELARYMAERLKLEKAGWKPPVKPAPPEPGALPEAPPPAVPAPAAPAPAATPAPEAAPAADD